MLELVDVPKSVAKMTDESRQLKRMARSKVAGAFLFTKLFSNCTTTQQRHLPAYHADSVGMGFRLLVAGGRHFTDYPALRAVLDTLLTDRLPDVDPCSPLAGVGCRPCSRRGDKLVFILGSCPSSPSVGTLPA